jgi:uncharacterized protein YjbI with pentapeptide repeats
MANEEQLKVLRQSVSAWNQWRQRNPDIRIDLTRADLCRALLDNASLQGAFLRDADLRGAFLRDADLRGAALGNASLQGAILIRADFRDEAFLRNANLQGAVLNRANFREAVLDGADLSKAALRDADLRDADLRNAILTETKLNRADLSGADLSKADLSKADLKESNLSKTHLHEAILVEADLSRMDLREADLSRTDLREADLSKSRLSNADLSDADLSNADLSDADLSNADLRLANLIAANLNSATLTDACLWETQRAGWSIQGIICEAVYWDKDRKERTLYSLGEFERLYADKTKVVLQYAGGIISPIEIATLPSMIEIMQKWSNCVLRLDSLQDAPGGATVTLIIEDPGERNADQTATLQAELKSVGQRTIELQRELLQEREGRLRVEGALNFVSSFFSPLMERVTEKSPGIQIHISGGTIHGNIAGNVSGENSEVNYFTKHPEGDTEA